MSDTRTDDVVRSAATETMDAPPVSVVVSSRNRAERLLGLLDELERLDAGQSFEVVVCDNASDDGTWVALVDRCRDTPLALTAVRRRTLAGPAHGRNAAARHARGTVLAFTDDDCRPDAGWLRAGLDAMADADVVAGRTIPEPAHEYRRGPFSRTLSVDRAEFFPTCNLFLLRDAFTSAEGFDESFSTPAGEDTDLAWRLLDAGMRSGYAPDAVIRHEITPSSLRAALRVAWRWRDLPRVARKHPDRVRRVSYRHWFWRRSHACVCLAVLGVGASVGLRRPVVGMAAVLPWLDHRVRIAPLGSRRVVWRWLPGALLIDAVEVAALSRGSIRHGTVFL